MKSFIKRYIYNTYDDFGMYPKGYEYWKQPINFFDHFPMYRIIENSFYNVLVSLKRVVDKKYKDA